MATEVILKGIHF